MRPQMPSPVLPLSLSLSLPLSLPLNLLLSPDQALLLPCLLPQHLYLHQPQHLMWCTAPSFLKSFWHSC